MKTIFNFIFLVFLAWNNCFAQTTPPNPALQALKNGSYTVPAGKRAWVEAVLPDVSVDGVEIYRDSRFDHTVTTTSSYSIINTTVVYSAVNWFSCSTSSSLTLYGGWARNATTPQHLYSTFSAPGTTSKTLFISSEYIPTNIAMQATTEYLFPFCYIADTVSKTWTWKAYRVNKGFWAKAGQIVAGTAYWVSVYDR